MTNRNYKNDELIVLDKCGNTIIHRHDISLADMDTNP